MNRIGIIISLVALCSCTGIKYLEEGEKYYTGADFNFIKDSVRVERDGLKIKLQEIVQPKPNQKLLGSRPKVWFYHLAGEPKKEKGFKHFMKYKLGAAPVLMADLEEGQMAARIENFLINEGYFRAEVEPEVTEKKHTGKVDYNIRTGPAYHYRDINYPNGNSVYAPVIENIQANSLIKSGDQYSLETLKKEQKRIEDYVEDEGFYYFDDNYLLYKADSTVGNNEIDMRLTLADNTPLRARQRFFIDDINIIPDFSLANDTLKQYRNTEEYRGYTFVNNDNYVRKDVLVRTIVLEQGNHYSETAEMRSRERLMALGIYKYVNIKFNWTDSAKLLSKIYLTPMTKKSIRLEAQAISKSNNFVGPALSASFQNRNAIRGAELLEVRLNGAYEIQVSGPNDPPLKAYELNFQTSLTVPRLVAPFKIDYNSVRFIPRTKFSLGAQLQQRVDVFRINTFSARYGFLWRETITKSHQLFPVNVSFVKLASTSDEFEQRLRLDPNLARSVEDQYIVGAEYEYELNTKNAPDSDDKRKNYYFNGLIETSGNLMNLVDRKVDGEESLQSGENTTYSQFAKAQADFRYYFKLGIRKELASRFLIGAARAYGNSEDVPFIKQFSSGGSNSVRAFRARSLGPGSFVDDETETLILDETGDIKLEMNVEYRSPIIGVIESALFVDAGNVWLWSARPEKPGGGFSSTFYDDIAVGTGAGLRFNFSFFILRFDLAFPLRKPVGGQEVNWVFNDIDFLSKRWRGENLLLNIAIGYPF